MMTASSLVAADGLHLGYRRCPVFVDATFTVPQGKVALLGPNGAGKSTLMEAVVSLTRPSAGRLTVLGHDTATAEGRAAIRTETAFLPQQPAYHPGFTVREHVEYCGWLKGLKAARLAAATDEAVAMVGLASHADRKLGALSGGMLRRAAIAATVVARPRLLVLDEPTAGLDPEQRIAFRSILDALPHETSVLLSTHLVEDVASTCEDIVVLADGSTVFAGSLQNFVRGDAGEGSVTAADLEKAYVAALGSDVLGGDARGSGAR